jgi:hypothetical protein
MAYRLKTLNGPRVIGVQKFTQSLAFLRNMVSGYEYFILVEIVVFFLFACPMVGVTWGEQVESISISGT